MTHWLHGFFFHVWHFLYGQVQLENWFGNVVAGVVTFLVAGLFWPGVRNAFKGYVGRYFSAVHAKLDSQHAEHLALAEKHHREALALATKHHAAHMAALAPAKKPSPTTAKAASTVKKQTSTPTRSSK